MRHLTILILSLLCAQISQSQINEIGVFAGGSNLIGDVGATNYISPNAPALGLIYKWNRSPRHSWRMSLVYSDLKADDAKSDDPRRQERDYSFDSNLLEISGGLEFTFIDFDLHSGNKIVTPYMFTGLSAALYDNYYYANGVQRTEGNSSWAFGIPMALGIKAHVIRNFVLAVEIGARYTFTDEIDGNVPSNAANQQFSFGNINNNDWYVFSGITLTYTFGENPCYCPTE